LVQRLSPDEFALRGEPPALVVRKTKLPPPELLPKDAVLLLEVVNYELLVLIDPPSKRYRQNMSGAQVVEHPSILRRMNNWTIRDMSC
jgi:hypothetical protein